MNSKVEEHLQSLNHWREEIILLRSIAINTQCEETIKWGDLCYTFNQKNAFIISPFKHYVSVNFFSGILLKDAYNILKSHGDHQQSARYLEFKSINDIEQKKQLILEYMNESIEHIIQNKIVKKTQKTLTLCDCVMTYFENDTDLKDAFYQLTPGRQRAYAINFCQPKSEAASIRRIEKYREKIIDGKGMHD
jgi:uncharacterized protein YdeI (YjbR/CyaY-like superfamily)